MHLSSELLTGLMCRQEPSCRTNVARMFYRKRRSFLTTRAVRASRVLSRSSGNRAVCPGGWIPSFGAASPRKARSRNRSASRFHQSATTRLSTATMQRATIKMRSPFIRWHQRPGPMGGGRPGGMPCVIPRAAPTKSPPRARQSEAGRVTNAATGVRRSGCGHCALFTVAAKLAFCSAWT